MGWKSKASIQRVKKGREAEMISFSFSDVFLLFRGLWSLGHRTGVRPENGPTDQRSMFLFPLPVISAIRTHSPPLRLPPCALLLLLPFFFI